MLTVKVFLILFSNSCYSQLKDSVCIENMEKIDSIINQYVSSLQLSNNYWLYYQAPTWGNGYRLNLINLDIMMEYRINTFKSKKIKKIKVSKSRIRKIRLLDEKTGNQCNVEFMEDGGEGCLKKIKDNRVSYCHYFTGTVPSEAKNIISIFKW